MAGVSSADADEVGPVIGEEDPPTQATEDLS